MTLLVLLTSLGSGTAARASGASYVQAPVPASLPAGSHELPALRSRTSRTYLLASGDYRAEVSAGSLNYKDAQGLWQPIDNTLVASGAATETAPTPSR
jgi:hypothetical protein